MNTKENYKKIVYAVVLRLKSLYLVLGIVPKFKTCIALMRCLIGSKKNEERLVEKKKKKNWKSLHKMALVHK